jgi:hypothetical protein
MAKEMEPMDSNPRTELPPMTNTERMWLLMRLNPGIDAIRLREQALRAGLPYSSISTLVSQIEASKRATSVLSPTLRHPSNNNPVKCYTAIGVSRVPALNEWLATLPLKSAAPEPPLPRPRPTHSRVKWTNAENRLVWEYLADKCYAADCEPGLQSLLAIAALEGKGWRVHNHPWDVRLARKFLERYQVDIRRRIQKLRTNAHLIKRSVPAPTAELAIEQTLPEPMATPQPEAVGTPLSAGRGRLEDLLRTIVRQELASMEERLMAAITAQPVEPERFTVPGLRLDRSLLPPNPPQVHVPKTEAPKKKRQVIVVGGLSSQFASVQEAFPQLDVRLVTGRMPAEQTPDLVLGVTRFLDHPLERKLRDKYGDQYVAVPPGGSASTIKQMVQARLGVSMAH